MSATSQGRTRAEPRRRSMLIPGLLLFLIVGVLMITAIWYAQSSAQQQRLVSQQRELAALAELSAGRVAAAVEREQAQLAALSGDDRLPEVARNDGPLSLQGAGMTEQFPGARRLALFPVNWDEARPDADPPVGFALLDMLRNAESDARPVAPEAHLLGREGAHVNFVHPVIHDDSVIATLVISYALDWARRSLGAPPVSDGGVELLQTAPDGALVTVMTLGDAVPDGLSDTRQVPGTLWRVRYSAAAASPANPLADPWFLTVSGVSLSLLAVIVWIVMRMLAGGAAAERASGAGKPASASVAKPAAPEPVGKSDNESDALGRTDAPLDLLSGLEVEENIDPESLDGLGDQEPPPAVPPPDKESSVTMDPTIFRAYDIRGVVGTSLSTEVVRLIGRAIGSEAAARDCPQMVVGRDGRLSSPELAEALIEGLRATGREVIDIGRVPTPVTYFATYALGTGSGVEVTGSHNPPDYNGLKIMLGGETLAGDAIADLHRRLLENDLVAGEGTVRRQDVLVDYMDRITGDVTLHRPLKVVVDCGNGVAGETAPLVLRSLGCEVRELFCDVDGTFPNHHPDPSDPANLVDLIAAVREEGADVGLAFDGDGDRLGVVDGEGKIIWPDRQMMLFAMDILSRQPGADIIFDVKCSAHLARIIADNAGVPIMWRTGHSFIKAKLKETGAPLAGEMSGHIFFNDRWDGFDDGIYAAARLLEILSMDSRDSREVFADLPETVSTPELKIHLQEGEPPVVIEKLVARARFPEARITTIDGLRVDFPDGWGLVRSSNTTPCLVLRFEADDSQALERIKATFRELIGGVRPDITLDF